MEMKKINRKYWLMPVIMFSLMLLWHFNCYATSNECEHQYGAAGYEIVKSERREAGCTADGYEEYWSCNKCHKLFSDAAAKTEIANPVKLPAKGHDLAKSGRREAGCTADGYEEYWSCNKCHKLFSDAAAKTEIVNPVKLPAKGHDLANSGRREAGCTADGYEEYWSCNKCHKLFSDAAAKTEIVNPVKLPSEGHDLVKSDRKEAGCTADGHEAYWQCSKCHRFFADEKGAKQINAPVKLPSEGHDLVKSDRKEAGCTADGHEAYWQCSKCHRFFSDEKGSKQINAPVTLSAEGHDLVKSERKEAGCTADGHEEYWQCSKCHRFFSDEEGNTRISEPKVISKTGHSLKKMERKEANCTESGYEAYWKCQNETCQRFFSDEGGKTGINQPKEIKATGHKYEEPAYIWSADNLKCNAERKCTACDDVEMETADATVTVVQEKNCILPELTMFHVTFKNDVFEGQTKENVKTAEATGHDLEKVEKKVANCTESGHEGYWKCQTCEKLFSDEIGTAEISNPIEIKATGHNLEKVEKKAASCTETGYEEYWKCQTCGKLFSDEAGTDEIASLDDIQIPAKGHEEGNEWLSDAEKHWKECAVCQEKTEEADHVYVNETDTVCEICGYERTIKSEVPEILEGHNGKWQMNSGKTLSFRSSAPFAEFISVTIDDVVVDEKNYDKAEGSTIITLHPEFLSTLSVGTHTLSIDSASGSAVTEFTIEEATAEPSITETPSVTEAPSPTTAPSATTASTAATVTPAPTASPETKAPKTGDESNVAIWMLLLFLSAEGIIVALQKFKKKTR